MSAPQQQQASPSEGGTKIKKNKMQQQQMPQQMQQQQMPQQMQQQQMHQQQMHQQQVMAKQQQMSENSVQIPSKFTSRLKSAFGNISPDNIKYSLLVSVIFIILNSKIVWKQITKMPFMGTIDPSMIALITNSILAGIVFFIVSKFVM